MGLADVLYCRMCHGRLSYPRAMRNGTREETPYYLLCRSCRRRAEQHRKRGGVTDGNRRARGDTAYGGLATAFLLGLLCGVVLMGRLAPPRLASGGNTPKSDNGVRPSPAKVPVPAAGQAKATSSALASKSPAAALSQPGLRDGVSTLPDSAPVRKTAEVTISDRSPKKGRGIRITLLLPEGAAPIATPYLQMRDARGGSYRSPMHVTGQEGEWVWSSGLDVPGRWTGAAFAPCWKQTLSAELPSIIVSE
jgi:hypothetical protein